MDVKSAVFAYEFLRIGVYVGLGSDQNCMTDLARGPGTGMLQARTR